MVSRNDKDKMITRIIITSPLSAINKRLFPAKPYEIRDISSPVHPRSQSGLYSKQPSIIQGFS